MAEDKFAALEEQVRALTQQMLRMMESLNAMRQASPTIVDPLADKDFRPVIYNQVNEQEITQNNFQISGQRSNSEQESEYDS